MAIRRSDTTDDGSGLDLTSLLRGDVGPSSAPPAAPDDASTRRKATADAPASMAAGSSLLGSPAPEQPAAPGPASSARARAVAEDVSTDVLPAASCDDPAHSAAHSAGARKAAHAEVARVGELALLGGVAVEEETRLGPPLHGLSGGLR